MKTGDFLINGKTGILDLNSWIETFPKISNPKRKKTFQAIEGSNAQAVLDEKAWDNREIDLSIIVRASNELDCTMRVSALLLAFDSPGYIDFTWYGEPNFAYRITNAEASTPARISRISYWRQIDLKLSATAFKYYKPGTSINVNGSVFIYNKFLYPSRPLIMTTGNSVEINGITYNFKNPNGNITIDCDEEQQDVYDSSGVIENAYDINQEFPSLIPGENSIKLTNGKIYPRWRMI